MLGGEAVSDTAILNDPASSGNPWSFCG